MSTDGDCSLRNLALKLFMLEAHLTLLPMPSLTWTVDQSQNSKKTGWRSQNAGVITLCKQRVLEFRYAFGNDGMEGGASSSNPLAAVILAASRTEIVFGSLPDLIVNGIACPWLWCASVALVSL